MFTLQKFHDPATNMATIDYETAEDRNYFKIDCLNVSIHKDIKDDNHLQQSMKRQSCGNY